MPAIRGEEELVQVSQQQFLGTPGEGCQVSGVREEGGDDWRLYPSTSRIGHDGKRTLAPLKKKVTFGEKIPSALPKDRALSSPETWPAWSARLGLLRAQGRTLEGFNSLNWLLH